MGVTARNEDGKIVAERIRKTDLNTSATLTADLAKPSKISIERKTPISGFDQEGVAAEALVVSYNKLRKTSYTVEDKPEEDSDYPDRVFTSQTDQPARIEIQIRHLDTEIIAAIGKQGTVDAHRSTPEVISAIQAAIDVKANIDAALKAKAILQLMLPAPLGEAVRQTTDATRFDCKGFKEIWISPFHEDSFPLIHT